MPRRAVGTAARRFGDHAGVGKLEQARWWTVRRASSRKPATYRCPFCGYRLLAMTDHMLIAPEGDTSRRRHAHAECVIAARQAGRLPSIDDWRATQPRRPSQLARLLRRRVPPDEGDAAR